MKLVVSWGVCVCGGVGGGGGGAYNVLSRGLCAHMS